MTCKSLYNNLNSINLQFVTIAVYTILLLKANLTALSFEIVSVPLFKKTKK